MSISDLVPAGWKRRKGATTEVEPWSALQQQMNNLFEDFFRGFEVEPFKAEAGWGSFTPRVNMSETEKEYVVEAELPGLDEKDIELSLTNDILTIRGHKKQEHERKEGENRIFFERSYGSFERSIPLTCEVDQDKIDASFRKGVLTVKLPKSAQAQRQSKKITVRAS
ncbi:MAG: Hsp20/alpha crystallin family protein [Oligoflexia bacterium]|nr:Hsp20/alpha crystallin family protein [Oligoflexia bacterium]